MEEKTRQEKNNRQLERLGILMNQHMRIKLMLSVESLTYSNHLQTFLVFSIHFINSINSL